MASLARLSAEDTRILRLETGRIAGHTCKVVVLRDALSARTLRSHIAARIERAPRLAQRPVPTPLGLATPVWAPDPAFDLARHVLGRPLRGPASREDLRAIAAQAMERRLPRDRPLWSIDVVERLAGGGTALVWLMHHAAADGASCMRLAEAVLWDRGPGEIPPAHTDPGGDAERRAPGELTPRELVSSGLADRARSARGALGGALRTLAAPSRRRAAMRELERVPATVRRELAPVATPSPFDGPIGARRAVAFCHRPVEQLERIAHAVPGHVTLNDVLLAAVAGGVRTWLHRRGEPAGPMRAKVPVSMHPAHEQPDALGNRDSFLFVDVATELDDPLARLLAVNAETARRRAAHDPSTLYALLNDASHVAAPLARAASKLAASPRAFTFAASNVRGPARPVTVAGAAVAELWSLAEIAPRHALRVSGISLAGDFGVGFTADPALVPDLPGLAEAVEGAVDELDAAV